MDSNCAGRCQGILVYTLLFMLLFTLEHPHISIKVSPQLSKKRMSFLYRPQGYDGSEVKSRSQSLISNSSFQSALNDNFLTPFAKVLVSMRHIKENLQMLEININRENNLNNNSLEDNNNNNNSRQVQNLKMIHQSIVELEDCFDIVESLETGKSIGESASELISKQTNKQTK